MLSAPRCCRWAAGHGSGAPGSGSWANRGPGSPPEPGCGVPAWRRLGRRPGTPGPGVECDTGTPGDLARLQGGEHPECRVEQQAARLKGGEMLEQELAPVPVIGGDE